MIESFLDFIKIKKLFTDKDRILLALSGGIDSMVMFDLFLKAGFKIGIVHCNFSLRGKESDGDEKFIRNQARRQGLDFYCRRFDTKGYARREKISIQMAARDLRYAYFEEIRKKNRFKVVATAHQLNDSAETFLFNLTKGTGLTGLKGISPETNHVVRPMLFATRHQLSEYAVQNKIRWREDSSNRSVKYSRNLIRHKVIPELLKINPNFYNSMQRTMERIEGAEDFILNWMNDNRESYQHRERDSVYLSLKSINKINEPVLLHYMIRGFGFSYHQALMLFHSLGNQPGARFYSASHVLTLDRTHLIIEESSGYGRGDWEIRRDQTFLDTGDGDYFSLEVIKKPSLLKTPADLALLDAGRIRYPLIIRNPKAGDRFQPLGMQGQQKLSDFMINNKIPRNLKKRLKLVVSENEIIWVAGYRIHENYKVKEQTKKVLKIKYSHVAEESF